MKKITLKEVILLLVLAFCLIMILTSCSTSKFVSKEFKQNPSSYDISSFVVKDIRVYDEYPDVTCQLDKCTKEEFSDRINGYMMFKRKESQIENPLLKTSVREIMTAEIRKNLKSSGGDPTTLTIQLSCIGYGPSGLMVSVKGEITFRDEVIWKADGSSLSAYDVDDFDGLDWDAQMTEGIKEAVRDCISRIPGYRN